MRCVRLTTYHLLVPNVKKIRGLNLPDPHRPVAGQLYFFTDILYKNCRYKNFVSTNLGFELGLDL
jgi:hypothetical protein